MVDPASIGTMFSGMGSNILPQLMRWVFIALVSFAILGVFYLVWMGMQHNILVYKLVLGESDDRDKKRYFIKKIVPMKARRTIKKGIERWKYMWKFNFSTQPIAEKNILPFAGFLAKSAAYVYELDRNIFIPSSLSFSVNSPATVSFTALPYDVRRAGILEIQEIAKEFQDPGFMAKYGSFFYGFLTILFCIILVGAVIWMTYKYIGTELGTAARAAQSLSESLKQGVVQKFVPGG